ncbi:MAG: hypothetical protein LJE70_09480 [Chromatiaceae bacterium]|nr:hypothetical protein [Chromatiaceae bacterium]
MNSRMLPTYFAAAALITAGIGLPLLPTEAHGWGPHPRPLYHRPWRPVGPVYRWPWAVRRGPVVVGRGAPLVFGITAITVSFLNLLNANQRREHERAMAAATSSAPGEVITWQQANARGSVETTRIERSSSGQQCREFRESVTIDGRTENAHGTACQEPSGAWRIVGH